MEKVVNLDEARKSRKKVKDDIGAERGKVAVVKSFDSLGALLNRPMDFAPSEYVAPESDPA